MADDERIDLSQFVAIANVSDIELAQYWTAGMIDRGPVTITGTFLGADARLCSLCGHAFAPAKDMPIPFATYNDAAIGPICADCAIELLTGE